MIGETLRIAVDQLKSGKMRSFLTTLGISMGVGTVIFIVAILEGYDRSLTAELNILGANTFQIQKRDINTGIQIGYRKEKYRKNLKRELADAVREHCDLVEAAGAEVWQFNSSIHYKDKKTNPNLNVAGGEPEFFINNGYFLEEGRMLTREDINLHRKVLILGRDALNILFPFEYAVGKEVKINGTKFTVVGILEKLGNATLGGSRDNVNTIPITTFEDLWGKHRSINLTIRVREGADFQEA